MKALIVGAGAIARQHLSCLSKMPSVEVVGICDLSAATARATAERFNFPLWSTDFEGLLSDLDPDIVHVTTPPESHFGIATTCLSRSKHVIVEKPLTPSLEQSLRLVELARNANRFLIEDYNYTFNTPMLEILGRISDNSFGEVVHVSIELCLNIAGEGSPYLDSNSPPSVVKLPGGAIADFLPHLASLAHVFIGSHREVKATWGRGEQTNQALAFDEFRAIIQGETATAFLSFSSNSQPDAFWVRVNGTRMHAVVNLFDGRHTLDQMWHIPRPLIPLVNGMSEAWGTGRGALSGFLGKLSGGPGAYEGLWTLLQRSYVAVATGVAPPVSLEQVLGVNLLVAALLPDAGLAE
jgi:predicted dehydrogenase